jgi:hypothetical protein
MDQFTALQRYHTRLATGKKTDFALPDMDNEANPDEMLELTRQAVLFKSEKPILDKLDQRVRANPKFESILDGSFLQPASYVKPKVQPTPDQLRNGFTLECFINTQQKFGVNHIISNGGSFAESGFSLLTLGGGGVVRGEFQNTATNEKILMDASYPYDNQWHHVAMTYDANKKETMLYLDGKPGTARTSYKSPLVFDPKLLRIGENELRGMGFTGGITDVRIWPKVLNAEVISKHALGEVSSADSPLVNLPLRFANAEEARQANGASGFMAQKVDWTQANQVHPMAKEQDWVFAQFRGQGFSNSEAFATLGALEYRLGNYQKALDLLIRSQNNGRYSTEVRLYPWMGGGMIDRNAAPYLIMAYKKCGYNVHYQLIRNAFNQEFNKFEMRTWEISGEPDVLERIKLKTLQREMNALADE